MPKFRDSNLLLAILQLSVQAWMFGHYLNMMGLSVVAAAFGAALVLAACQASVVIGRFVGRALRAREARAIVRGVARLEAAAAMDELRLTARR